MRKNVVVSESSITTGQLINFFQGSKIEEKSGLALYNFDNFQHYLSNPDLYAPETTELDRAIKLLGAKKVVTAEQWGKAWKREVTLTDAGILKFSQSVLQSVADSNKAGHTDYRLVYCGGISLREQHQIFGTNTKKQPCYYASSTWWLDEKNDSWAKYQPKPGYRLLDYKLRYRSTQWQAQEDEIAKLGTGFSRAHETDVSEGAFSFYQVHGGERLLETAYHWGQSLDSGGRRVCVGYFDAFGWHVVGSHPDRSYVYLGVVVARN